MKKYIIAVLTTPLLLSFNYATAQTVEEKKVVIVKEIEDENGKVTREEKILTGAEAEKYINENKHKEGQIAITIDKDVSKAEMVEKIEVIEKEVTVDVEEIDGKEVQKIRIKIKDEDGKDKVLEWDGEGEMPEDMKAHMKNVEIIKDRGTDEKVIKIISRGDGDHTVIELDEELELPEEVKEKLKKHGIKLGEGQGVFFSDDDNDEIVILKEGQEMKWQSKTSDEEPKVIRERIRKAHPEPMHEMKMMHEEKGVLGVRVENHINGILIHEVVEDSPAEKAGIKEGDIIFKIGKKHIGSVLQLTHELKSYEGKTASIKLLRNGKTENIKVAL